MALKQRLDQRQVQKLIMVPSLQQAIKLLTLSNLELLEVIDQELSQNPMLEAEGETRENQEVNEETAEISEETRQEENEIDSFFQEYFDNGFSHYFAEEKESFSLENMATRAISLWDHLNWQASLTFFQAKDREIAQYIIGNINEDGFLEVPVEEIAKHLGVTVNRVEQIREKIKRFDPVGVASRDFKEALLTQFEYYQIEAPLARKIIEKHLSLLEKSDYQQLARELGISLSEIKHHIDLIRQLNPKPGRKYSQEKISYVVPDIIVTKEGDDYRIELNNEGLPKLRINRYYQALLKKQDKNSDSYQFLRDRLKKAYWFLRSLDQRNRTIYRVAEYIVEKQKNFLEKGIDYIQPLTLNEIAQQIGVHESTVGRVVANKYIQTPRGVFPLKYFFHRSLTNRGGEEISSLRIKERIKKLIEQEDKNNPLSDGEIAEILSRENYKVARRTVAKYRIQLGLEPSHIRKRKYLMEE
ncbi:MAG: RNA polymerase factor sigma-54 [Candidatus Aminicenantes bacterium]|nr:RNA polymerase factor sigma-54 [Candidatus Aminicenantes bacterium]